MKKTLQHILQYIMSSYLIEKQMAKAIPKDHPLGKFVRHRAPMITKQKASLSNDFEVMGSVGQGN